MSVFVIMPFAESFLPVYTDAIRPSIVESGAKCLRADEANSTGPMTPKIHTFITESTVCVADLTGANPNVIYEVAYALANQKKVILITQGRREELPFDIRHHFAIEYRPDGDGLAKLKQALKRSLEELRRFDTPTANLQKMLAPSSLDKHDPFVVAASPLSYQTAYRTDRGWRNIPLTTISDHVGIRGLMQGFGLIYGLDQLPELVNPEDFDKKLLEQAPMHLFCIGSPKANYWTLMMMQSFFATRSPKWAFRPDSESPDLRNPSVSIWNDDGNEWNKYKTVVTRADHRLEWDYGLIIRGPNPAFHNCLFMALAGRSSRGTEACSYAVTDPGGLRKLVQALDKEGIDLDNHRDAFCAVVSIRALDDKKEQGPDPTTLKVEDVVTY